MKIATWNINSIRLRINQVLYFLKSQNIDILCLQETKTPNEFFPSKEFEEIGYVHQYFRGEKSYNGVAIFSKIPIKDESFQLWCGYEDARHNCVTLENNIYLHRSSDVQSWYSTAMTSISLSLFLSLFLLTCQDQDKIDQIEEGIR